MMRDKPVELKLSYIICSVLVPLVVMIILALLVGVLPDLNRTSTERENLITF